MKGLSQKGTALFLAALLACAMGLSPASAKAKTLADALEGFASGQNWFGEDYAYDIADTKACWELLQKPITVLNVGEREVIYPLTEPGGKKVKNDHLGGCIAGTTSAVHVLGKDENGWTLIEGLDEYDRLIQGYVKTKLLKTVTPNKTYGVIIDKLVQRLYVFIDGEFFSSCAISTGLPTGDTAFNETASGEYLISSWVGDFETDELLVCQKGMRFNNGDLLHQVPYLLLGDGTMRFSDYEKKLGQKASHGCVRVARYPNDDGLCIDWLWDNLKKETKVVIWDDDGRLYPYPAADTPLFYNQKGGSRYHSTAHCSGVKPEYLPLSGFTYGELDSEPYAKLTPCDFCTPVKPRAWIDEFNLARGVVSGDPVQTAFAPEENGGQTDSEVGASGEAEDSVDNGGAVALPVQIEIY